MTETALAYNMRLIGHHDLDGFGNGGEGMVLQLTGDHRRFMYIAHESAPKNFTVVEVTDPREPKTVVPDRPAASTDVRSNSLDVVGDMMAVAYQTTRARPHAGRLRAVRHAATRATPLDLVLRPLRTVLARHALPVVRRRRDGAPEQRRAATSSRQQAGRPVLPDHRRHRPDTPARRSAAGGCPARASAMRSHRPCATSASTPASARTTPTCTRSGPTAATSAISTAARSSSTSRTWRTRSSQPAGLPSADHRLHAHDAAAVQPGSCSSSDEAIGPGRQGLAQAGVGRGHPRRDAPDDHRHAADPGAGGVRRGRGGRFGAHNLHEN